MVIPRRSKRGCLPLIGEYVSTLTINKSFLLIIFPAAPPLSSTYEASSSCGWLQYICGNKIWHLINNNYNNIIYNSVLARY